jgi:hypothetical protein
VQLPPKDKELKELPGLIKVFYTDESSEILQVDTFGISEEMPGFITMWSDSTAGPLGFFNTSSIKKIIICESGE